MSKGQIQLKGRESKYFKDRTGEIWKTNQGYFIKIIEYFGTFNCTIQYEDGRVYKNIRYGDIKAGSVSNPYHPSVSGVGYEGVGKYNFKLNKIAYIKWTSMLDRCYGKTKKYTYKEVTVCEEWHNFQNFTEWFEYNFLPHMDSKWQLDKDIKAKSSKIYSPNTCCIIPKEINIIFTKRQNYRGDCPIGVVYNKKNKNYVANCEKNGNNPYLGSYKTKIGAFYVHKIAKEKWIKENAIKWKNSITDDTYEALINYKVEITD